MNNSHDSKQTSIVLISLSIVLNVCVVGYIFSSKDGLKEVGMLVAGGLIGYVSHPREQDELNSSNDYDYK